MASWFWVANEVCILLRFRSYFLLILFINYLIILYILAYFVLMLCLNLIHFLSDPVIIWYKSIRIHCEFFLHNSSKIVISVYFMIGFPLWISILFKIFLWLYLSKYIVIKSNAFISLNLKFLGSFISLVISIFSLKSSFIYLESLSLVLYKSLTSSTQLWRYLSKNKKIYVDTLSAWI